MPRKVLRPLPDRLLTVREVAEWLRVHPNTVRKMADSGLLSAYRIGARGDRRFSLNSVRDYLNGERSDTPIVDSDRLLSVGEAAIRLGIHPKTLVNWSNLEKLHTIRIGSLGERRFTEREIEALLEEWKVMGRPPPRSSNPSHIS